MNGVRHIQDTDQCHLIIVDDFGNDLKNAIRARLCEICYGLQNLQHDSMFADYQRTIGDFLDRYDAKTYEQKKGIIGELLTHVLVRHYLDDLEPASILFNKEERSMRKGFDLIFLETEKATVWYSEVKSGHPPANGTASSKSLDLLETARTDIARRFTGDSNAAWLSAIIDSHITVSENVRPMLRQLLEADAPVKRPADFSAAAILVSVVYASLANEMNYGGLSGYFSTASKDKRFSNLIIVSVQKETVEKVAEFLRSET